MRRRTTLVLAATLAAASCTETSAPTSPQRPVISRVIVSPATATVDVGRTVRLTAQVLDGDGNPVSDRGIDWFSQGAAVADVSSAGVVTGVAAGVTTITASVDGIRGTARVTVNGPATDVVITSVSPAVLVEGEPAIINGRNFGLVASNNRVTVDGVSANVTSATATQIQFTVPRTGCRPARTVNVQVRMLATPSNVVQAPLRPAQTLNAPVGQLLLVRDPAQFCMQLPASAAAASYLIGVQSVVEDVASLTPVLFGAVTPGASGDVVDEPVAMLPPEGSVLRSRGPVVQPAQTKDEDGRHLRAHALLQRDNLALLQQIRQRAAAPNGAVHKAAPSLPQHARVGEVFSVRVPGPVNLCTRFTPVTAVVRHVGTRSIVLEDTSNPAGGYGLPEIQAIAAVFENAAYDLAVTTFGAVTDIDGNGRIAILISREVNQRTREDPDFALAAFVSPASLVSTATCPSSNEGEWIFVRTPDPAGRAGSPTGSAAEELVEIIRLIGHEFVHVIQFAHVLYREGVVPQPPWLVEAQATMMEELMGHRVTGRATGRNYGYDVVSSAQPIPWYSGAIYKWPSFYFGWNPSGERVTNAPEQCSWIGMVGDGNRGPCSGTDYIPYGIGFLFLRWLADHYAPGLAGGERALQQALVDNSSSGFAAISSAVGVPMDALLAQWAAMLYLDDRVPNLHPRLTLPSWNLFELESHKIASAHLLPRERAFSTFSDAVAVRGGSSAYFRVSGTSHAATALRATAPDGSILPGHMRMWIVRMQ